MISEWCNLLWWGCKVANKQVYRLATCFIAVTTLYVCAYLYSSVGRPKLAKMHRVDDNVVSLSTCLAICMCLSATRSEHRCSLQHQCNILIGHVPR